MGASVSLFDRNRLGQGGAPRDTKPQAKTPGSLGRARQRLNCSLASFVQARGSVSFGIYLVGIILVIGGLVYAAAMLHAPVQWIVVATLMMLGVGVVAAVKATRQRDSAK